MSTAQNHDNPIVPWVYGSIGAISVVVSDWARWYFHNIPNIDILLIHLAKIGGIVVTSYSILILHRKWVFGTELHDHHKHTKR